MQAVRYAILVILVMVATLAGCGEPTRSRSVPATESGRTATPGDAEAVTKDPRRIATH